MALKRFPLTSANSYSSKYRPGEKLYAILASIALARSYMLL